MPTPPAQGHQGARDVFGQGAMRVGLAITPSARSIHPARLARAAEERGFAALFVSEHTHIPVALRTPYPSGGELPDEYRHALDPFSWLMAAASSTERLWLGTGVCLVAQHDPLCLAKQVASVDVLCGGRLVLGIGFGWNVEEAANHGVPAALRRDVARENVLAMKRLWSEDIAEFHGRFVNFTPSWSWPKPTQRPHPLVMLGAAEGRTNFRHLVEYCDGWMMYGSVTPGQSPALTRRGRGTRSGGHQARGAPDRRE